MNANGRKSSEDNVKLPESILSKIRVINDTPDIPLEPESVDIPVETIASGEPPFNEAEEDTAPSESARVNNDKEDITAEPKPSPSSNNFDEYMRSKANEHAKARTGAEGISQPEEDSDPTKAISREEILRIRSSAIEMKDRIGRLLAYDNGEASLQHWVGLVFEEQYADSLKRLPIEHLNDQKLGIRVSALRAAGYDTIYSIRDATYKSLMRIRGIGERSASLAVAAIDQICRKTRSEILLNFDTLSGDNSRILLRSCHDYIEQTKWKKTVTDKYGEALGGLNAYISFSDPATSGVSWKLTKDDKKLQIINSSLSIRALLQGSMWTDTIADINSRDKILKKLNGEIYSSYEKDKALYNATLRRKQADYLSGYAAGEKSNTNNKKTKPSTIGRGIKKILIIIAITIVSILVLALVIGIINSNKSPSQPEETTTITTEATTAAPKKTIRETESPELQTDSEYIFSTVDSVLLKESDVNGLALEDIQLAINELYAMNGRIFTGDLGEYFASKSWYEPLYTKEEFAAKENVLFNETEKANLNFLINYRDKLKGTIERPADNIIPPNADNPTDMSDTSAESIAEDSLSSETPLGPGYVESEQSLN